MLSGLALLMKKVLPYHADRNTPSPSPERTKMRHFNILDMFKRHQYINTSHINMLNTVAMIKVFPSLNHYF